MRDLSVAVAARALPFSVGTQDSTILTAERMGAEDDDSDDGSEDDTRGRKTSAKATKT